MPVPRRAAPLGGPNVFMACVFAPGLALAGRTTLHGAAGCRA